MIRVDHQTTVSLLQHQRCKISSIRLFCQIEHLHNQKAEWYDILSTLATNIQASVIHVEAVTQRRN